MHAGINKAKQLLFDSKIPAPCNVLHRSKINTEKWTQQNKLTQQVTWTCSSNFSSALFNPSRYQITAA